MLAVKLMSKEDLPDSTNTKGFTLFLCDSVHFYRDDKNRAVANIVVGEEKTNYLLDGNAYVMQDGKTIASYASMSVMDYLKPSSKEK